MLSNMSIGSMNVAVDPNFKAIFVSDECECFQFWFCSFTVQVSADDIKD